MTKSEIIEMARQAGVEDSNEYDHLVCTEVELVAFAKLIAEKERDACAEICENFADVDSCPDGIIQDYHAHLIRLRGKA